MEMRKKEFFTKLNEVRALYPSVFKEKGVEDFLKNVISPPKTLKEAEISTTTSTSLSSVAKVALNYFVFPKIYS
jgi:hypothetical protein